MPVYILMRNFQVKLFEILMGKSLPHNSKAIHHYRNAELVSNHSFINYFPLILRIITT